MLGRVQNEQRSEDTGAKEIIEARAQDNRSQGPMLHDEPQSVPNLTQEALLAGRLTRGCRVAGAAPTSSRPASADATASTRIATGAVSH